MRLFVLILIVVFFWSCASGEIKLSHFYTNTNQTQNTRAHCINAYEILPKSDGILDLYINELVRRGIIKDYSDGAEHFENVGVCLLNNPEPCCIGKLCVKDTDGIVRDKAGCSNGYTVWVSKTWPAGKDYNYDSTLVHEIGHLVAGRLNIYTNQQHNTEWYKPDGVEDTVLKQWSKGDLDVYTPTPKKPRNNWATNSHSRWIIYSRNGAF